MNVSNFHCNIKNFTHQKGVFMNRKFMIACFVFFISSIFISCVATNDISNVTDFQSEDHEKIYQILEKERKNYNNREPLDISFFTENAEIMTRYKKEDIILTPNELKKIWPEKIQEHKNNKVKIKTVEVNDLKINNNKAFVDTTRTYYSRRWNKYFKFEMKREYMKVHGEWKLHRATYKEI